MASLCANELTALTDKLSAFFSSSVVLLYEGLSQPVISGYVAALSNQQTKVHMIASTRVLPVDAERGERWMR